MSGRLVALDGTPDISLESSLIVVGRHPSCDISLDSVRISRVHCCLFRDGKKLYVRDLNSTNGVRVNGQIVTLGLVVDHDILSIAHLRFRLESQSPQGMIKSAIGQPNSGSLKMGREIEREYKQGLNQNPLGPPVLSSEVENAIRDAIAPVDGLDRCHVEVNIRWRNPEEDQDQQSPKAAI